jgi:glucose-fructose oxidoreductase
MNANERSGKVRYAVVGLGWIAQSAVLPAFAHAKRNSELAALVSDDPEKLKKLGRKYGVKAQYTYEAFEDCLEAAAIDAVYIALPNHLHREYTERAARAGVHVLCEKPLATSVEDCEAMIEAARRADVRLMTAYRLHFEGANREAIQIVDSGKLGETRFFHSSFSMELKDEGNIRLDPKSGGGTLWDIGIYCINAVRGLFHAEPDEVFAWTASRHDERFREVEEMSSAILRFPGHRLATFTASFGAADVSSYRVIGTRGDLCVEPAYEIAEALSRRLTIDGRSREKTFKKTDQFAPEILHFSECIQKGKDPAPSGEEGLADVRVIEALYRSVDEGAPVELEPAQHAREIAPAMPKKRPAGKAPLVHTQQPTA